MHGAVFNQWGVGGSVTAGPWNFTEPIPPAPTEVREREIEYETTAGVQFGHRILFPTAGDAIPTAELTGLADFVDGLP